MASVREEASGSILESKTFRLILLRRSQVRREGSLAAALAQSMALAVIGTAGAYPSWVLVQDDSRQIILGAAWAIAQIDPAPNTPLLGRAGGPLMMAIAFCCLFSVLSGSLALTMDFLGRRRCRSLAPFFHGLTAILIACAAALGSCLLALVRGRSHLEAGKLSTSPGQSLFLAFLACALASTATGLSCMSPALVQPARSSWDLGRPGVSSVFHSAGPTPSATPSERSAAAAAGSLQDEASRRRESTTTEGGRSGKVHWRDTRAAATDPEAAGGRGGGGMVRGRLSPRRPSPPPPEERPAPNPREEKSSSQRLWGSGGLLLGQVWKGWQRRAPGAAEGPGGGNPAGEQQEAETGHEAPLEGQAPNGRRNRLD